MFVYVVRYVAECCSVLQSVAVCCSVLQCVAVCCSATLPESCLFMWFSMLHCVVLQCAAVCCSVLQCVAVPRCLNRVCLFSSECCSVLQCVACVAVCCSATLGSGIRV